MLAGSMPSDAGSLLTSLRSCASERSSRAVRNWIRSSSLSTGMRSSVGDVRKNLRACGASRSSREVSHAYTWSAVAESSDAARFGNIFDSASDACCGLHSSRSTR